MANERTVGRLRQLLRQIQSEHLLRKAGSGRSGLP
jgi:hypothetical protein